MLNTRPDSRRRSLGRLLTLALVAGLGVGLGIGVAAPAVSGTQPLTLAQAKKVFLKKKKASRTYVTKSQAAAYLTQPKADARYLPRGGETRIPVLPSGWVQDTNTAMVTVTTRSTYSILSKNSSPANNIGFFAPAPVPGLLAGRSLSVVGAEVCYVIPQTALAEPVIDEIAVQAARSQIVPITLTSLFTDGTGRVDSACTTLRFAPVPLLPNDLVGLGLTIDYPDANTSVNVGRASLIVTTG